MKLKCKRLTEQPGRNTITTRKAHKNYSNYSNYGSYTILFPLADSWYMGTNEGKKPKKVFFIFSVSQLL